MNSNPNFFERGHRIAAAYLKDMKNNNCPVTLLIDNYALGDRLTNDVMPHLDPRMGCIRFCERFAKLAPLADDIIDVGEETFTLKIVLSLTIVLTVTLPLSVIMQISAGRGGMARLMFSRTQQLTYTPDHPEFFPEVTKMVEEGAVKLADKETKTFFTKSPLPRLNLKSGEDLAVMLAHIDFTVNDYFFMEYELDGGTMINCSMKVVDLGEKSVKIINPVDNLTYEVPYESIRYIREYSF